MSSPASPCVQGGFVTDPVGLARLLDRFTHSARAHGWLQDPGRLAVEAPYQPPLQAEAAVDDLTSFETAPDSSSPAAERTSVFFPTGRSKKRANRMKGVTRRVSYSDSMSLYVNAARPLPSPLRLRSLTLCTIVSPSGCHSPLSSPPPREPAPTPSFDSTEDSSGSRSPPTESVPNGASAASAAAVSSCGGTSSSHYDHDDNVSAHCGSTFISVPASPSVLSPGAMSEDADPDRRTFAKAFRHSLAR